MSHAAAKRKRQWYRGFEKKNQAAIEVIEKYCDRNARTLEDLLSTIAKDPNIIYLLPEKVQVAIYSLTQ